ncbi:Uncharacterised protein [Brevibacterium casei]|uniref:Uncharacterized protein n=1 Tax=Brevibacterium casei TaxID=33889 RepID=A0A449DBR2_9MICO|nr:Uncharacterised protein [Brevibacterium casei]
MTKPTTKSGMNHAIGAARRPRTRSLPLIAAPTRTATAVSAICANARIEHAMTLPNMSTFAEAEARRISTIRDCFSSTTEDAIVTPKVIAELRKMSPRPSPMNFVSVGSGASGSRISTSGVRLSAPASDSGADRRAMTVVPVGESGESTTAAATASVRTSSFASSTPATSTGSMPSIPATVSAEVTATLSVEANREGSAPDAATAAPKRTIESRVEIMNAFDFTRTMISRSMTRPMAVVKLARVGRVGAVRSVAVMVLMAA